MRDSSTSTSSGPKRAKRRVGTLVALAAAVLALAAPAAAEADWGAIALDPNNGAAGVSYDYTSLFQAKQRAISECASPGCRAVVWVYNGYAALVLRPDNVYFAGIGRTRNIAFQKARIRSGDSASRRYAWVYSG